MDAEYWVYDHGKLLKSGAAIGTPGDAKCVTEILGETKIRKFGGTKFKFSKLVLRKRNYIVATRCHIVRLKCIKFDFGWCYAPDPAGGAHSPPTDPSTSWI